MKKQVWLGQVTSKGLKEEILGGQEQPQREKEWAQLLPVPA